MDKSHLNFLLTKSSSLDFYRSLKNEKSVETTFPTNPSTGVSKQNQQVCFAADRPVGGRARKPNRVLVSLLNILRQGKEKTENLNQTGMNSVQKSQAGSEKKPPGGGKIGQKIKKSGFF